MIKKFDGTIEIVRDVMTIDNESFKDIDCSAETLCKRLEKNKQYELYVKYEDLLNNSRDIIISSNQYLDKLEKIVFSEDTVYKKGFQYKRIYDVFVGTDNLWG